MEERILSIDVSGHNNPRELIEELEGKYPDQNVKISLNDEGDKIEIMINPELPLQLKVNIGSFLCQQIQL